MIYKHVMDKPWSVFLCTYMSQRHGGRGGGGGVGVAKMGAAREGGSAVKRHDNDSPVIVCNDQSLSLFFSDNTISGIYLSNHCCPYIYD